MTSKRLAIYLNDHLAGATVGVELGRRCQRENSGTPVGRFLSELVNEIVEDLTTLLAVMNALAVPPSKAKIVAAWSAEKLGRLKMNGQVRGYSPLSRLVELEGLATGIEGKRCLWLALAQLPEHSAERLSRFNFDGLAERARGQRERLEPHRLRAAAEALS